MKTKSSIVLMTAAFVVILALALPTQTNVTAADDPPPIPLEPGIVYQQSGSFVLGESAFKTDGPLVEVDLTRPDIETRGESRAIWPTVVLEDFEGTFPSTGWTVYDADGATNGEFYWAKDDYKPKDGTYSAWPASSALDPFVFNYPHNADSWMVYGPFDLSDATMAQMKFDIWHEIEASNDRFIYAASADCINFYGTSMSGNLTIWATITMDLTNVPTIGDITGDPAVCVALRFQSNATVAFKGPFVDNVHIQKYAPPPPKPTWIIATDGTSYANVTLMAEKSPTTHYLSYTRATDPGSTYYAIGITSDTLFYDTSAVPGEVYYYKASACNAAGCGQESDVYDPGFRKHPYVDFNGDNVTDTSIYRPSNGRWYFPSGSYVAYGITGDIPVPGDYDGDGVTDVAVYRPSNGTWYIRDIGNYGYGIAGDIPMQCDYDGDGDTDIAIYRPSNGRWYIKDQAGYTAYGITGDIPVPADYDGDGDCDIAIYRPSNGRWYPFGMSYTAWGIPGDIPVPGDYDCNGDDEITIYRPSNGRWYYYGFGIYTPYGIPGDIPVPGDYDGDTCTDPAIYRPSNGRWYVYGQPYVPYGIPGDYPLPARDTNLDGDPHD